MNDEAIFLLLILAAVGFFALRAATRPTYDISQIPYGATKDDVRKLWGAPHETIQGHGSDEWVYAIPFHIYVSLEFNSEGKVESKYRSGDPV